MQPSEYKLSTKIKEYCAEIGRNSQLVQGPGGNISWKDGSTLYIKASGKWLANAKKEEIFVSVDLLDINRKISKNLFSDAPKVTGQSTLKPSIETMLHALMPHKIVLHLHAIEILAHLIRKNSLKDIERLVDSSIKWVFVDYFKPGDKLAEKICMQYQIRFDIDCIFLKNHGIVIGGESIERVDWILKKLISDLKNEMFVFKKNIKNKTLKDNFLFSGYSLIKDRKLNLLATNSILIRRLKESWSLYPDHIVFLGAKAFILERVEDLSIFNSHYSLPCFIFAIGIGVFESSATTKTQKEQLLCYYDVLTRQTISDELTSLSEFEISELLNWEAEKYRNNLSCVKS